MDAHSTDISIKFVIDIKEKNPAFLNMIPAQYITVTSTQILNISLTALVWKTCLALVILLTI